MMDDKEKRDLLIGAGVAGGVVLFVIAARNAKGGGSAPLGRTAITHSSSPNPQTGQVEQSLLAARASAVSSYNQTASIFDTNRAQLMATINTNQAQIQETHLQTAAATAIGQAEATAQQQAAMYAAQAQEQVAQQQSAASQTQSTWGGITSIFTGLLGFLGFNQASQVSNPYGAIESWQLPPAAPVDPSLWMNYPSPFGGG